MKISGNTEFNQRSRGEAVPSAMGSRDDASSRDVLNRTNALCRGLELILLHHSCKVIALREIMEQVRDYLVTSKDEEVWLKRSKFLLTFPNAKYTKNDPPSPPDIPFKFKGIARKWFKNRLISFSKKNSHLFFSWFQGKRSSLPASDDFVDKTYDKHFETLTKEDKGDEFAISAIFSDPTFEYVLKKVRKEIDRNFTKEKENIIDNTMSASSSACFEQTRGIGGQLAELQRKVGLKFKVPQSREPDEEYVPKPDCSSSECDCDQMKRFRRNQRQISKHLCTKEFRNCLGLTSDLHRMVCLPQLHTSKSILYNAVREIRCPVGFESWEDLKELSRKLELENALNCTIQAVLEPFKVRVISKGNALPYYSCRPLQKILWKSLKEIPCFRLIGRPLSTTDILDLKFKAQKDWEWFSIDYSAATDGISWRYTSRILRFLLANQPKRVLDLALAVLGPHNLYYPSVGAPEYRGLQTNGQLMGSILSFPILCLANLGTYLVTMRNDQQGWTKKEILNHVLVNGDDMVYAAPPSLWERHIKVARDVGLEMSIGKAYHHGTYLNINSMALHSLIKEEGHLPVEIPYLNVGLFFGLHKVQGYSDDDDDDHHSGDKGIFANVNTLMAGSLPDRKIHVLKQYIALHKEKMVEESKMHLVYPGKSQVRVHYRNWFLPISSGGMGVCPPDGWKFFIRPIDKNVVANLLLRDTTMKTCQRPLPGYPVEKLELEASVPWYKSKQEIANADYFEMRFPRLLMRAETKVPKSRTKLEILSFSHLKGVFKK